MKTWIKLAVLAVCLGLLIAGCSVASHLDVLQPPKVPLSKAIKLPSLYEVPCSPGSMEQCISTKAPAKPPAFQRGIDIDWYAYPGQNVSLQALQVVGYIKSLHANAVSISFPFFMNGNDSGSIHTTAATPSPADLAALISDAEQAGLYVVLRPLLDEASLDVGRVGGGRVGYAPPRPAAWFAGYKRFLDPYLRLAFTMHVDEFIIGTELDAFNTWPQWNTLDAWARTIYKGQLACADNWNVLVAHGCGRGVTQAVDAYAPQRSPVLTGWLNWDRRLAPRTVLAEVGIAAAPAAFSVPWRVNWPISQPDPGIQARWFTAACTAAIQDHLGGIYFWSVGMGSPGSGPTVGNQGAWSGGPAAAAISSCFSSIERTGK